LREPFLEGQYAEAGAARIPDVHDLTVGYAKEFGLTLIPLEPKTPRTCCARGQRFKADDWNRIASIFNLTEAERSLGPDGLPGKSLGPLLAQIGDPRAPAGRGPISIGSMRSRRAP
jgi:monoamine oxidase